MRGSLSADPMVRRHRKATQVGLAQEKNKITLCVLLAMFFFVVCNFVMFFFETALVIAGPLRPFPAHALLYVSVFPLFDA